MAKSRPNDSTPHTNVNSIMKLYREAVSHVPILRYSWVLIATICILALTAYFKLKNSDVFLFAIALIVISLFGFAISFMMRTEDKTIRLLLYVLITSTVITLSGLILSFGTFVIWERPDFYLRWFPREKTKTDVVSTKAINEYLAELNYRISEMSKFITDVDTCTQPDKWVHTLYLWRVLVGDNAYVPLVSDFKHVPTITVLSWFNIDVRERYKTYEKAFDSVGYMDNMRDKAGNYDVGRIRQSLNILKDFTSEVASSR